MPGIMSGLEPVKMQEGGDASKSFYNLRKTAPGSGANLRDVTDFLFDPTDPVDYLVLGMMAFPPAGIAAKLIQAGVKGNKLRNTLKKVEAAKGLTLGPTREGVKGKAAQLLLRQEMADLIPHNRPGAVFSYSDEMKEYIRENPDETYEGGLPALIESMRELGDVGKEVYEIAQTEDGRQAIAEEIKGIPSALASSALEADYSRYNPLELLPDSFTKRPSEINKKADGGIMMLSKGSDVLGGGISLGRAFLNKVKKNPKLQNKDGSPKKSTKEYKDEVKKQQEAKKAATAQKRAETRRAKQEAQAREETERQARLSRAEAARARTGETPQQRLGSQSAQADVGPARPIAGADGPIPSQGPTIASKVDESLDASKKTSGANKVDDGIPEGGLKDDRSAIQKLKKPALVTTALVGGASLYNMGDEDEIKSDASDDDDDGTSVTDDLIVGGGGTKLPPVTDNSLAYYVKQELAGKGFDFDPQTQTFTGDKKPSFFDYVKSLPSGYMEKVGNDPDYAKKMMAGFLNMMKPVEGYVPINPAVAFGEGYLGEETRQADMLPADAKLLEYFKSNPQAYKDMLALETARAGAIGDYKIEEAQKQSENIKRNLIQNSSKYTTDDYQDLNVFYKDPQTGKPVGPINATTLMSLQDRGLGFFANEFYLEPK